MSAIEDLVLENTMLRGLSKELVEEITRLRYQLRLCSRVITVMSLLAGIMAGAVVQLVMP